MSSQHVRIVRKTRTMPFLVIALLASFLSGCSVATNDSTSAGGPLKMTVPQQECLKTSLPIIQQFFQGNAAEEDLNDAWSCLGNALTMFSTSTRGANPAYYTSRELRSFLETFFMGDIKISDRLLTEVFRLKQVVVGGDIDKLTRSEIAQTQTVIQVLRSETQRLRPYMKFVNLSATTDDALRATADVESAIKAVATTTATLGSLFGRGTEQYNTEDAETLLAELKPLFKNWKGPEQALNYIPTFEVGKTLLLNPAGNRIAPSEWQPLLTNAGRLYAVYLRAHYLMASQDLMTGAGLAQLSTTYEELFSVLKGGIEAKASKMLTFSQIDAAVDELYRLGLLNADIRDTTVKGLERTLFQKILTPMSKGARPAVKGVTLDVFERLHQQGQSFLEMQAAWDQVVAKAAAQNSTYLTNPIPLSMARTLWPTTTTKFPVAKEDLRQLFAITSPITFRENGPVRFDNRLSEHKISVKTFTKYNWVSVAIRAIMNGYATDAVTNRYSGVTADQLHAMFNDIHELGVDLQVLEPKDDRLWQTSFNEANMFMVSADANDHISYFEAFDFLSYMLGGGVMTGRIFSDAKENCQHIGQDAFGRPMMDMPCFRQRNQARFASTYAELPWWVKTYNDLGPSRFGELQSGLEVAARNAVTDNPVSTSDVTRMTMVMQYIESIFVRFDADRSGTIGYTEAQAAFPLFKDVLNTASKFNNDRKNLALFCYLLRYGKPPTSLGDKIYFQLIWLGSESKWKKVQADRMKVLGIVGALKASMG